MVNPATPSITHHQLLSLGIISAVGIYWNKTSLAAYYSVQACEFASSRECLEIYAGLYAEGLGKHLTCGLEVKSVPMCCVYVVFFHILQVAKIPYIESGLSVYRT